MNMKDEIKQQLLGNMIIGRLEQRTDIYFQKAQCSGTSCIRFSSPNLHAILKPSKAKSGAWKDGNFMLYEIYNTGRELKIQLSVSNIGLNQSQSAKRDLLIASSGLQETTTTNNVVALKEWSYKIDSDLQNANSVLDDFFDMELTFFETELQAWIDNPQHVFQELPQSDNSEEQLTEGAGISVLSNRFERNPEARRRCIAHYGTTCRICGFNFGDFYGKNFAGMIEVHHIVPISEIREDYIVDPLNDLIPVCPNCHAALHSKQDGVYTPEELMNILFHHQK